MHTQTTPVMLFLADISGYTPFMLSHRKAPVHGQMIISGLMETLMRQVDHPLKIVELEGDALFLYAMKPSDAAAWDKRGRHLWDVLLRLFDTFDRRRAELAAYSVCRCGACANLQALQLKIVAHSGTALLNQVGEFSVLSGIDVIAVHRLLKNSVERDRYILMTDAAFHDLRLPEGVEVTVGSAEYDIGTLITHLYCPEPTSIDLETIRGTFADDNVAVRILRHEIQSEYTEVASDPSRGFHFNLGRAAAEVAEYEAAWLERIPSEVLDSFAGTGNPFSMGRLHVGEHVLDVGSGAGADSLIAANMVGPDGHVIGVEMTPAMIEKARRGAAVAGLSQVEFREGHAEALPVPDSWADVVISNGVLNLSPHKSLALGEMLRVLKPGGRLQIGDITVSRPVPEEAKRDIDLWTN